jgi:hypothetical protein
MRFARPNGSSSLSVSGAARVSAVDSVAEVDPATEARSLRSYRRGGARHADCRLKRRLAIE